MRSRAAQFPKVGLTRPGQWHGVERAHVHPWSHRMGEGRSGIGRTTIPHCASHRHNEELRPPEWLNRRQRGDLRQRPGSDGRRLDPRCPVGVSPASGPAKLLDDDGKRRLGLSIVRRNPPTGAVPMPRDRPCHSSSQPRRRPPQPTTASAVYTVRPKPRRRLPLLTATAPNVAPPECQERTSSKRVN